MPDTPLRVAGSGRVERRQGRRLARLLLGGLLALALPCRGAGQEMDLPVANQWPLLDRILNYDRTFAARTDDGTVVAIVYQSAHRASVMAHDEVRTAAQALQGTVLVAGRLTVVSIEASTAEQLAERLRAQHVDLVYVTPMRAYDIREVARASAAAQVPSFTGVREYVPAGVGVGVGLRGGTAEILVNLPATRAQGMDLNAQLLRLVTVIEPRVGGDGPDASTPSP